MNLNEYVERTQLLVGDDGIERLKKAHVLVAGVGGVGGACVEALGRAGIGKMTLIDFDRVAPSNCNRQVVALRSTVGRSKIDVMAERLKDLNPEIDLALKAARISPSEAHHYVTAEVDVVLDCIDAISSKIALIQAAQEREIFVASSMGAGGRVNPAWVKVADLYETSGCPMATAVRKQARRAGIKAGVRVVYSNEPPLPHVPREFVAGGGPQKTVNGTISYMPGLFGFFMASEALRYLLRDHLLPEDRRGRIVPLA